MRRAVLHTAMRDSGHSNTRPVSITYAYAIIRTSSDVECHTREKPPPQNNCSQTQNGRVKNEKEPATFLVWGWTLNALVHEKSKLESLDEIKINDKPAFGIRVSETITPPMDLYFDQETKRLARIQWRTDRHEFSDWKEADGAWYASKCVGYKLATGKRWYHTEILELVRLKELPAGLGENECCLFAHKAFGNRVFKPEVEQMTEDTILDVDSIALNRHID